MIYDSLNQFTSQGQKFPFFLNIIQDTLSFLFFTIPMY